MTDKTRPRIFYDVAVYVLLLVGGIVLVTLGAQMSGLLITALISPASARVPAGSGPMPSSIVEGLLLLMVGAALIIPGIIGLVICLVRALRRKKAA